MMHALVITSLFILGAVSPPVAEPLRTMRLDYYHTGGPSVEVFAVDRMVVEPLPWPGSPRRTIDDRNLGEFLFEVMGETSKELLYSRGFCSIYGEWMTTEEARTACRTFHESLRFPLPAAAARIRVKKRDAANGWREVWTTTVDPLSPFVDTSRPDSPGALVEIEKRGDPSEKVDLLILGDGYTLEERKKFEKDARRLADQLFAVSPFRERRRDFNVWGLCPPARESGVSRPASRAHRDSPLGTTYDVFGLGRYVLTFDNRAFRRTASFAPYDFAAIVVNSSVFGGGGIFHQYSTTAADTSSAAYIFVHEFGHHFAGLADEYYLAPVAYLPPARRIEPWEPNVTALLDPAQLKWKDLVSAGTPIPTPWPKEAYERPSRAIQQQREQLRKEGRPESEVDAVLNKQKETDQKTLQADSFAGKVGAFEGAMYQAQGYYRPQTNCTMFSRTTEFCAVCRRAIEQAIDFECR